MGSILCYGTLLARSALSLECSKVTIKVPCCLPWFSGRWYRAWMWMMHRMWYLDDGALSGSHPGVLCALHLIEELGPTIGLHVNLAECMWS